MDGKELFKSVVSSKSSIAAIGIIALCWIATISPGQVAIDENAIVSVVPMPKGPAAEVPVNWKIPLYVFLITIWTVGVRGVLEYFKQRDGEKKIGPAKLEPAEPGDSD